MCLRPFRQGVAEFGCGQCMPCRVNNRRKWTSRLLLEQLLHAQSWFVTLTYDEENYPTDGSLSPRELQLFLKRLRESVVERLRFFGVGEYGDNTLRAHYHLALYGLEDYGHVQPEDVALSCMPVCRCPICRAWGMGGVDVRELTPETAAYICGYTVKKLTKREDPRLQGRHPEFARMSRRPGIGAGAVPYIAKGVESRAGALYVSREGDVPAVVRQSSKLWPMGRYLRRKLREELGMDPGMPAAAAERLSRELQAELLRPGARAQREEKRLHVGRVAEARQRITNSRKGIGL